MQFGSLIVFFALLILMPVSMPRIVRVVRPFVLEDQIMHDLLVNTSLTVASLFFAIAPV